MKSSAKNVSLNSYDDIFSTEESRVDAKREKIMDIPLTELYPFPDHPFQVRDDDSMKETVATTIKGENGTSSGARAPVGIAITGINTLIINP